MKKYFEARELINSVTDKNLKCLNDMRKLLGIIGEIENERQEYKSKFLKLKIDYNSLEDMSVRTIDYYEKIIENAGEKR